jgi:adenylate kinase
MAYKNRPDLIVPDSEFRCEVMTKPCLDNTYQIWRKAAHRCVRRATQSRSGRIVCSLHSAMPTVEYWNGQPDTFIKKVGKRRYRVPAVCVT